MKTQRAGWVLWALLPSTALAATPVNVVVPDRSNLQYMTFFVARGAGFFEAHGVETQLLVPEIPAATDALVKANPDAAAVLPPPVFTRLAADNTPIVLVANLLSGEPINLIVQGDVAREKNLNGAMPLKDKLLALKGLRIGVAPNPPTRMRLLFPSAGMDVDKDLTVVILKGREQNAAFREHRVDALHAHTPYLEKALVDQGGPDATNHRGGV